MAFGVADAPDDAKARRDRAAVVADGSAARAPSSPSYLYGDDQVLYRRTLVLTLAGGITYGYNSAIIAGSGYMLTSEYALSHWMHGFLVASFLIGTALGSPKGGAIADRFGRRLTIALAGLIAACGALASAAAPNLWTLLLFRLLCGVGAGVAIVGVPLYVSEVAPAEQRGRMGTIFQVSICSGTLLAYVTAMGWNPDGSPEAESWRWRGMFACGAAPSVALIALARLVPESARWLQHRAEVEADEAGGRPPAPAPASSPASPRDGSRTPGASRRGPPGFSALIERENWNPLAIAMVITFAKKFTGINIIIYYAPSIFRRSGFGSTSLISTVILGIWNLLSSLVAIRLIDSAGRRPLLICGLMFAGAADILLGLAFGVPFLRQALGPLAIVSVAVYIAAFEIGIGPLFFVCIAELFPQRARGAGVALCGFLLCFYQIVTSMAFPPASAALGDSAIFLAFGAVGLVCGLFIWRRMPETKGLALEDVQGQFPLEGVLEAE